MRTLQYDKIRETIAIQIGELESFDSSGTTVSTNKYKSAAFMKVLIP